MLRAANTLVDEYEVISEFDDAVERPVDLDDAADSVATQKSSDALEEFGHRWKMYRDGVGEPPLKDGASPTYLRLRHISETEKMCIFEKGQEEGGLMMLAARFALVGARNLELPNGKPFEVKFEFIRHGGSRFRVASRESLDVFPSKVQLEIGNVAVQRLSLRPS